MLNILLLRLGPVSTEVRVDHINMYMYTRLLLSVQVEALIMLDWLCLAWACEAENRLSYAWLEIACIGLGVLD